MNSKIQKLFIKFMSSGVAGELILPLDRRFKIPFPGSCQVVVLSYLLASCGFIFCSFTGLSARAEYLNTSTASKQAKSLYIIHSAIKCIECHNINKAKQRHCPIPAVTANQYSSKCNNLITTLAPLPEKCVSMWE